MLKLLSGAAAALLISTPLAVAPALAAGGGGSNTPNCKAGEVYDQAKERCVPKSSSLDTDSLYETGRALAYAGRYEEAIDILKLAEDRNDPRVLNMLGYSHRKQGHLLIGLGYYEEALRIDPDHVLTREYMGEAFLQMGDLASARSQLDEIARRAGADSKEYGELAAHIAAFEQKG